MELDLHDSILKPFDRVTEPGAVPGTIVAVPEEPKPVIQALAFSNGDLLDETLDSLDGIKELTDHHTVTLVNVTSPSLVAVIV